jgi:hypothetical protein
MGKTRGPYKLEFPEGTRVRIASRQELERFQREWRLHDPLQPEQLAFADHISTVARTGIYHRGDELYWFDDIPRTWHECCLCAVDAGRSAARLKDEL